MFKYILLFVVLFFEKTNAADDKGGMPQLNPESFTSQVFWLFTLFSSLFLINHYLFLPKINKIRKERDDTIENLIKEADLINDSINQINEKMRADLEEAKNKKNSLIKQSFEKNKKILDRRILEINSEFENKKLELNSNIESNRNKMMSSIPSICVSLSDNLYEKIMGEKQKGSTNEFNKFIEKKLK